MGCGASRAKDQEEDEYYEEETRSVQTSARLHRTLMSPRMSTDEGRQSKNTDKSIESEKWDTFEIASSERGNTAKDSGYGRERSVERIMLAKTNPDIAHSAVDEMGHPNRIHSPTRKEQIRSPPRQRRSSPPPRSRRRTSEDYHLDSRGRRLSPQPDRRNGQLRRMPSRNYDSDPDELERRRRRSFDDGHRRRIEDDLDEGYRSGANSNHRSNIPRADHPNMTRRYNGPPSEPSQRNINYRTQSNPRRPRSAPDNNAKRRPDDKAAPSKLYSRKPNQSNEQNPRTKSSPRDSNQNSQKLPTKNYNSNSIGSPKKSTVNHKAQWNSDIRVADPKHKKGPPPPPWKLAYTGSKPAWSSDLI